MKTLVIGGTGRVGAEVVNALLQRGSQVRVLTRNKEAKLPNGVEAALGDLTDPESVRAALAGVDKMFLLVGNVADELTQTLLALAVARETKIKHLTYLSVYQAERFPEVPHFIGKHTVERALEVSEIPYTILRPGYFFQNDGGLKSPLTGPGLYPTPIGTAGIAAVDIRDIADAAAVSLTTDGHAGMTYNLANSVALSGPDAATIWSAALKRPVKYADLSPEAFEGQLRKVLPAWYAMELRLMFQAYQQRGFFPNQADAEILTQLVGHAPRQYKDFVNETVAAWAQ